MISKVLIPKVKTPQEANLEHLKYVKEQEDIALAYLTEQFNRTIKTYPKNTTYNVTLYSILPAGIYHSSLESRFKDSLISAGWNVLSIKSTDGEIKLEISPLITNF